MNLHVTSHLHPAAMAPASVDPSTTKFCFLSGFLEHLPSAKHSKNLFQSPWAGRDPGTMWSQLLLKAGVHPGPHQPKPGVFLPPDICSVMPPVLLHLPFRPSPAPPSAHHPPHSGPWLGGRQPGASEQCVHWANGSVGLPAALFPGKGRRPVALLPLSTDKVSLLTWAFLHTWHMWHFIVPVTAPLSNVVECGLQDHAGKQKVWCFRALPEMHQSAPSEALGWY